MRRKQPPKLLQRRLPLKKLLQSEPLHKRKRPKGLPRHPRRESWPLEACAFVPITIPNQKWWRGLVDGDEVTILSTWSDGKDTWAKLDKGWAAMAYDGETYIKLS